MYRKITINEMVVIHSIFTNVNNV